jgi:hypothetical protein
LMVNKLSFGGGFYNFHFILFLLKLFDWWFLWLISRLKLIYYEKNIILWLTCSLEHSDYYTVFLSSSMTF